MTPESLTDDERFELIRRCLLYVETSERTMLGRFVHVDTETSGPSRHFTSWNAEVDGFMIQKTESVGGLLLSLTFLMPATSPDISSVFVAPLPASRSHLGTWTNLMAAPWALQALRKVQVLDDLACL